MKNMLEKSKEKPLSKKERTFCQLKYEDEFTDEQIAMRIGISPSLVYEWIKKPRIQKEIDRLGEADTKTAIRVFQKNARRAAKATVKLTETRAVKDEKGKLISQDFVQPGEVVRKAAADILQAVEINVKAGEGAVNINIVDKKLEVSEIKE